MHRFGTTAFELKTDAIQTTEPELKKEKCKKTGLHVWTGFLFIVTTVFGIFSIFELLQAKIKSD